MSQHELPGDPAGAAMDEPGRTRGHRRHGGRQDIVAPDRFGSYYGLPILQPPVWRARSIASYFFLGGLAGASSVLAAGAQATGRGHLERACKVAAAGAIGLSLAALVEDLGRPERFPMMLRVIKPTSPMSVGSWVLAGYGPAAAVAALSVLTGRAPRLGRIASTAAALLGPVVASYTAVLASDTAVPAWHDAYRELPFVFTGSAAAAASGLAMVVCPQDQVAPVRRAAVIGGVVELAATRTMDHRMGLSAQAYRGGRPRLLRRLAELSTGVGVAGAVASGVLRPARLARVTSLVSGLALMAGSAFTRFAVFEAGRASTQDPRYVVEPQRARLEEQG